MFTLHNVRYCKAKIKSFYPLIKHLIDLIVIFMNINETLEMRENYRKLIGCTYKTTHISAAAYLILIFIHVNENFEYNLMGMYLKAYLYLTC